MQLSIKNSRFLRNLRKKRENTKRLQKGPLPKKRSNNSTKGKGLPRQNCQWITTVFVNVTEWEEKRFAKLKSLRSYDTNLETPNVRGKCSFNDFYFLRLTVKIVWQFWGAVKSFTSPTIRVSQNVAYKTMKELFPRGRHLGSSSVLVRVSFWLL